MMSLLRSEPEDVGRNDELLIVQVISELCQVVHICQLPAELVTVRKRDVVT